MSDYTVDVRAKVTPEQHRILSLYAQLHGAVVKRLHSEGHLKRAGIGRARTSHRAL